MLHHASDLDLLVPFRLRCKAQGDTVVWTHGCFDLFHKGHYISLYKSSGLGATLIVGVNSDASVRALKGPSRPVLTLEERLGVLSPLEWIHHLVVFEAPTAAAVLDALRPDVVAKGGGRLAPDELAVCERRGLRVVALPVTPGISTTGIIERILRAHGAGPSGGPDSPPAAGT